MLLHGSLLQIPTGARSPGVHGPLMDFGRRVCLGFKGKIWSEVWLPSLTASVRLTTLIVGNAPLGAQFFQTGVLRRKYQLGSTKQFVPEIRGTIASLGSF
jgi:hypothetical protein